MKRLGLLFVLIMASLSARAYDDDAKRYYDYSTNIDGVYYRLNTDNKTAIVSYKYQLTIVQKATTPAITGEEERFVEYHSDYSGDVHIPNEVVYEGETYSVTAISNDAFSECSGLTSITIPNSVTSIGNYAFQYCTNLVYITFPSRLASIGNSVFYSCYNLIDVYCHAENVPSADNSSFSNSSNITLHIPYATLEAYKSTEPWNQFKAYVALSNGVSQGKCAKPTINIVDGKAVFNCETPSVSFHWSVSTSSGSSGVWNNSISLPITLNVFATKDGYENSDVATYEFFGINGDVNNDGEVNVADHVKLSEIIMNSNE